MTFALRCCPDCYTVSVSKQPEPILIIAGAIVQGGNELMDMLRRDGHKILAVPAILERDVHRIDVAQDLARVLVIEPGEGALVVEAFGEEDALDPGDLVDVLACDDQVISRDDGDVLGVLAGRVEEERLRIPGRQLRHEVLSAVACDGGLEFLRADDPCFDELGRDYDHDGQRAGQDEPALIVIGVERNEYSSCDQEQTGNDEVPDPGPVHDLVVGGRVRLLAQHALCLVWPQVTDHRSLLYSKQNVSSTAIDAVSSVSKAKYTACFPATAAVRGISSSDASPSGTVTDPTQAPS